MEKEETLIKLDILTFEADMLSRALDNALKFYKEQYGICEIYYLSEILREKFEKIRDLF